MDRRDVDNTAAAALFDHLFGRKLEVSIIGFADEIAAAASLLQGQAAEAQPVVVVRGLTWRAPNVPVAEMIRPPEEDLFQ